MGGAMKYFRKKLLGHEVFRSMVSWATKFFLKNLKNPQPPSYILNVRSLKNLEDEYRDLYIQSNTLLADVFESFRNNCLEISELDPVHFISALGLAWQAALRETKVQLELLTYIDMLLMVKKVSEVKYLILLIDMQS